MKADQPSRQKQALLLVVCVAIFLLARVRWLSHLLMWDEAMNLCTVRAFVAGGQDFFSGWFWRYPPTFNLLTALLHPLEPGFDVRAGMLVVFLGVITLLILFLVNREAFGFWPAIWSCYIWSVLPGSAFFGVWIKQDVLVAPFGLAALYLFAKRRHMLSGLLLGCAFLAKEFALFYAAAIFILWLVQARGDRKFAVLTKTVFMTLLVSAWWYIGFSSSVEMFFKFATETTSDEWNRPWYYYLASLHLHVGLIAMLLMLVGVLALRSRDLFRTSILPAWPLALMLPTWLILSMSEGKAPWYTATIYPAYATLAALGLMLAWKALSHFDSPILRRVAVPAAAIALSTGVWSGDYEERMKGYEDRMWWSAYASREAAQTLNRVADDEDRVLVTPMHYYDHDLLMPCPIFSWYLKDVAVLLRPQALTFEELLHAVRDYDIQWAMLSPPVDYANRELLAPLAERTRARPLILQGAFVVRTDPDLQ